jgi:hypothetical protein
MFEIGRGFSTGTSISMLPMEYGPEVGERVELGYGRWSRSDAGGRVRGFFALGTLFEDEGLRTLRRRAPCSMPVIRVV